EGGAFGTGHALSGIGQLARVGEELVPGRGRTVDALGGEHVLVVVDDRRRLVEWELVIGAADLGGVEHDREDVLEVAARQAVLGVDVRGEVGERLGRVVLRGVGLDALRKVGRLARRQAGQDRLVEIGVGALGDEVDVHVALAVVELIGERVQLGLEVAAQRMPEGDLHGGLQGRELAAAAAAGAAAAGHDQERGQQASRSSARHFERTLLWWNLYPRMPLAAMPPTIWRCASRNMMRIGSVTIKLPAAWRTGLVASA